MDGRGRVNAESELEPMRNAGDERIDVDGLVADGMDDEANVADYTDDDGDEGEALDDLEDATILA